MYSAKRNSLDYSILWDNLCSIITIQAVRISRESCIKLHRVSLLHHLSALRALLGTVAGLQSKSHVLKSVQARQARQLKAGQCIQRLTPLNAAISSLPNCAWLA